MCKLSLNIVPNVYNSLQSSFLSLAWPWPGRSLPKGNQWEWWDPKQGPLPGLGEVGHSPRGTSQSAWTWTGSQCGWAPSPLPPPMHPWHPYTPDTLTLLDAPLMAPQHPYEPPQWPLIPPIPLLAPEYLHSLPAPNTPLTPLDALQHPPNSSQHPLGAPMPLIPPIPLLGFNCCHFATDHLCTVKMLIFYCHFQLSSLCNWPSSQVCPVYKIPCLGVKNTFQCHEAPAVSPKICTIKIQ